MKNIIYLCFILLGFVGVNQHALAQKVQKSPKAVLSQKVGLTDIIITYSRPGLKGRDLATLAPNGKVWRTGANEATVFTISNPITIGGKELAAGTYSLHSIPADGEWTLIVNSKQTWGNRYDESADVMRFSAKATKTSESTETMVINIADIDANGMDANLELRWGNVSVKAPFTVSQ